MFDVRDTNFVYTHFHAFDICMEPRDGVKNATLCF